MRPPTPLSAVLITRDEERRLPAALESVAFCDERVVVDAGSTDRTRELAEQAGARVIVNAPWPGFVAQRRLATASARHDWVLALDADERVSPALREEIEAWRREPPAHAGYLLPRTAFYLGRWIRGTDWYPDLQLRLFDRRRAGWEGGLVHERVHVEGRVGRFRQELHHYSYDSLSDHLGTIDRYAGLWAQQAFAQGRRAGLPAAFAAGAWAFFRNYVLRRGLLLGGVGLAVSTLNAFYAFVKLARLRELSGGTQPEGDTTAAERLAEPGRRT